MYDTISSNYAHINLPLYTHVLLLVVVVVVVDGRTVFNKYINIQLEYCIMHTSS